MKRSTVPVVSCLVASIGFLAVATHGAEAPAVTAVGAINWDCSLPSSTFFGGYQTRSLSPARYRHMTPYYADVLGPDKIDYHWRTQAEYDREMQYAIDAGIDYFAYCWYADDTNAVRVALSDGPGACVDRHVCELVYARNMHLKSALRSKLKLCAILCGSHPYTDGEVETLVRAMKEDCYQKALGRPLLYLFGNRGDLLARVRQTCRRLGVASPYAVAMYGGRNHPRDGDAAIDALSAYPPPGAGYGVYGQLMDKIIEKNAERCKDGWATIPQFSTGKDHSPRIESPVPWCDNPPCRYPRPASGEEIVAGARRLRDWILSNRRSCPTGHIITFAWNEFEEGGWICPTWTPQGPDTSRVKAFAEAARILKSPPPDKDGVCGGGKYGYFTEEALAQADVSGLAEKIEARLAEAEDRFAEAETLAEGLDWTTGDAIRSRVEIARNLVDYIAARHTRNPMEKDSEILAWQGAEELRVLFGYFAAEKRRASARAALPNAVTFDVRKFGAKGDGTVDDGPALRKALAAAAACGTPAAVRIPAGRYLVRPCEQRDRTQERGRFHFVVDAVTNLTIRGEGTKTEIVFADSTMGGFGFWNCAECEVADVAVSYVENPSSQGTIAAVEKEPFALLFRKDAGYPAPDEPRFMNAWSRRFTAHRADGLVAPDGTGRMGAVQRIDADTFRLLPPEHEKGGSPYWHRRKAGEKIAIIARYSEEAKAFPVYFSRCAFSGAKGVTVYDAPGQNFIFHKCYAMRLLDCVVEVRPGSDDLVASNADGCMASGPIGPYVRGCSFSHMEDDGFNVSVPCATLHKVACDGTEILPGFDGDETTMLQVDSVTGQVKAFLRKGSAWNRLAGKVASNSITSAEAKPPDPQDFVRLGLWKGKKGEVKPDKLIRIPSTIGAVIKDTKIHDLRGMAVQVHCANMLVENLYATHLSGPAFNVNPLFGWGMMFNVHNILIRNCSFDDCPRAFNVQPGALQPGVKLGYRMIQGVRAENCRYGSVVAKDVACVKNSADVWIDGEERSGSAPEPISAAALYRPSRHVGKPAVKPSGGHAPFKPLAGYLDSACSEDIDTEIAIARNAGIEAFIWDLDVPDSRKALEEGFCRARNDAGLKVALSVQVKGAEEFLSLVDEAVKRDFGRPSYWRKGNGPVLVLRGVESLPRAWGGSTNVWSTVAEARRRVRAAGFGELYLHGLRTPAGDRPLLRDIGFDSIGDAGVDARAMPVEFARRIREAKVDARRPLHGNIVILNAWNDWENGRAILPSVRESDQMLRCVGRAFGRRPAGSFAFCAMRHWWDAKAPNGKACTIATPTFENVKYGPHMRQGMDVWLPPGTSGKRVPCVIDIHGGGWMEGDRMSEWQASALRVCRKRGYALVLVSYRLIPDANDMGVKPPVTACLDDAVAAIKLVKANAAEWGIDTERIGLTGGSAGACSSLYASLVDGNALGIWAVKANWPQTTLDPKEMREWIPNCTYGAHAFGYADFAAWLEHRDECMQWIDKVSPIALLRRCEAAKAPKFLIVWHELPPKGELPKDPTHAGMFGFKFAEACRERGISCERLDPAKDASRFFDILAQDPAPRCGIMCP